MKREGWQHGMVRRPSIILQPPCNPRHDGKIFDSSGVPPTAGTCTKASSKPTNHWKFGGKCRRARCQECHSHPISKSRNKAKGTYKLKACDVALNHKLVSWRIVVDEERMVNLRGASASEILSHLSGNCCNKGYEDDDHTVEDDVEFGHGDSFPEPVDLTIEEEEEEEEAGPSCSSGDEDGGDMGFYVVELSWDYLDEEDWLVVGEK
ncbi:uncharacterized protein LOC103720283 [Phoenix dactylifera]|uniref:Uncharacterized protein LOC103720283 n=1 Tax=Phoenix dactylifera TaxID=42345 RepID=A0A8B7MWF3_PHODC|nr:uncharacterized protein LOC103720283 [Phoenix dactylifera]